MPPSSSGPLFDQNGRLVDTSLTDVDAKAVMRDPTETELLTEIGSTGLNRHGGSRSWVEEEWLVQLKDNRARYEAYREMVRTATAGGVKRAIMLNIARLARKVEPPSDNPKYQQQVEFVESCFDDMYPRWGPVLDQILSCLEHGWSWFELTMKRRQGPNDVPWKNSEHDDGMIGWGSWGIRSQKWLNGWVYAPREQGGHLIGMRHLAPPDYREVVLPLKKSLHFRLNNDLDNPEGESILRSAYRNYWFVKRLEELEGVGLERDLAGLPVARVPPRLLSQNATPQEKATLAAIDKMLRGVRRDAREGIIFPLAYDADRNEIYRFELMSAAGSGRQQMIDLAIRRHESRIAQSMLADFMMLGQEGASAAFALSADKTALFLQALDAIAEMIAEQINDRAIPWLYKMNGWDIRDAVEVSFESAKRQNIAELATYIATLSTSGIPGFNNNLTLTKHLFKVADLPEPDDELLEQDMLYKEAERNVGLGLTPEGGDPMERQMALQQQFGMGPDGGPEGGEEAPDPEAEAEQMVMQERVKAGFDPRDGETPIVPGKFEREDQIRHEEQASREKQAKPAAGGAGAGKPPKRRTAASSEGGDADKPQRPSQVQKAMPRFDERKIKRGKGGRFATKPKWTQVATEMLARGAHGRVSTAGARIGLDDFSADALIDPAEIESLVQPRHVQRHAERDALHQQLAVEQLGDVRSVAKGLRERHPHLRPKLDGLSLEEAQGVEQALERFSSDFPDEFASLRRVTTDMPVRLFGEQAVEQMAACVTPKWRNGEVTSDMHLNVRFARGHPVMDMAREDYDVLSSTAGVAENQREFMDLIVTHETAHVLQIKAAASGAVDPLTAVETVQAQVREFDDDTREMFGFPRDLDSALSAVAHSRMATWTMTMAPAATGGGRVLTEDFSEAMERQADDFYAADNEGAFKQMASIYAASNAGEFFAENFALHRVPGMNERAKAMNSSGAHPNTQKWVDEYRRLRFGKSSPQRRRPLLLPFVRPTEDVIVRRFAERIQGEL